MLSDVDPASRVGHGEINLQEIDPELVRLPRKRHRVGALLALSGLVFSIYIGVRLAPDLSYARLDTPIAIETLPATLGDIPSTFGDHSFVEISATPDVTNMVLLTASGMDDGHRLAPVLGTSGALWLLLPGSPWGEGPIYHSVFRGRRYRLGDLPGYRAVASHLGKRAPGPVAVAPEQLRAWLQGASELQGMAGERLTLQGDTPVTLVRMRNDRVHVLCAATQGLDNEQSWRLALEQAGVLTGGDSLVDAQPTSWLFNVEASEGIEGVRERLAAKLLHAAQANPIEESIQTRVDVLKLRGDELVIASTQAGGGSSVTAFDVAEVSSVWVELRPSISPDAVVVVTTQHPEDYWYLPWLLGLLSLFALFFTWLTWRAVRFNLHYVSSPSSLR